MNFAGVVAEVRRAAEEAHRLHQEGVGPARLRGWQTSASPRGARDRVRAVTHLLRLAGTQADGRVIVDVGCGTGHDALILTALGARRVVAVDSDQPQVDFVNALARRCEVDRICSAVRRTASETGMESECADVVLCNEALSHFLDADAFLGEAKRVLRPGGCLIVVDGNNAMNPLLCWRRRRDWCMFETGHGLPPGRLGYRERRRRLIAREFPDVDEATLQLLSEGTFGLPPDSIRATCRAYLDTADASLLNHYQPDICPVDPEDGGYAERLLDARELAGSLLSMGCGSTRFWARCGNRTPYWMLNGLFAWLTPLTIRISPAFILVAHT